MLLLLSLLLLLVLDLLYFGGFHTISPLTPDPQPAQCKIRRWIMTSSVPRAYIKIQLFALLRPAALGEFTRRVLAVLPHRS